MPDVSLLNGDFGKPRIYGQHKIAYITYKFLAGEDYAATGLPLGTIIQDFLGFPRAEQVNVIAHRYTSAISSLGIYTGWLAGTQTLLAYELGKAAAPPIVVTTLLGAKTVGANVWEMDMEVISESINEQA